MRCVLVVLVASLLQAGLLAQHTRYKGPRQADIRTSRERYASSSSSQNDETLQEEPAGWYTSIMTRSLSSRLAYCHIVSRQKSQINIFTFFISAAVSDNLLDGLRDYEIVVPTRVDEQGDPYPHERHFRKRSADPWDRRVWYTLHAFGQKFHLNLTKDLSFVAPSFIVQHLDGNKTWLDDTAEGGLDCYYSGNVHGQSESSVAVSLCHSLVSHTFNLPTS